VKSFMRNSSGGNANNFWNVEFLCGDLGFNCHSAIQLYTINRSKCSMTQIEKNKVG